MCTRFVTEDEIKSELYRLSSSMEKNLRGHGSISLTPCLTMPFKAAGVFIESAARTKVYLCDCFAYQSLLVPAETKEQKALTKITNYISRSTHVLASKD